jgi:acetate kinase
MMVLTVNAGSSSVRLVAMRMEGGRWHRKAASHSERTPDDKRAALRELLSQIGGAAIDAVAHRVVHGGDRLTATCRLDADTEAQIRRLAPLAPLHNPAALDWIQAARAVLPGSVPHVAAFDTAFFATLPAVARTYALPRELCTRLQLRRYGFHGLAHQGLLRQWCALETAAPANARVISLQLGSGCSITASRGGVPIDTSMGFSPLEGLVMATRSGDVDPGLLLHLQRTLLIGPQELDELLNTRSGLLGVSGHSGDMRTLLECDDDATRLALDLYCQRARKYVGAYLAVLGGADAVLFGGGVGEHAPVIRERILAGMEWAKIELDPAANRAAVGVAARISPERGPNSGLASVWTLPVDEAVLLAEEAARVLRPSQPQERPNG